MLNAWHYDRSRWQCRDARPGALPCLKCGGDYWSTAGRLQVEEAVEADGQASRSVAGELAHGKQDAGHEAGAVEAVGPNGQLLAGIAEEHFLVGVEAAQTHGVHVDAVDHLAA